MHIFINEPPAE